LSIGSQKQKALEVEDEQIDKSNCTIQMKQTNLEAKRKAIAEMEQKLSDLTYKMKGCQMHKTLQVALGKLCKQEKKLMSELDKAVTGQSNLGKGTGKLKLATKQEV
jgi:hypothetical protein